MESITWVNASLTQLDKSGHNWTLVIVNTVDNQVSDLNLLMGVDPVTKTVYNALANRIGR